MSECGRDDKRVFLSRSILGLDGANMESKCKRIDLDLGPATGYTLQRFLIARKYDVEKAFLMLMNYIEWRVSEFPENQVKPEDIETSLAAGKVQVLKYPDKQGHICIVVSKEHMESHSFVKA